MYTNTNYKTKKALKAAVARGDQPTVHQSGPFGDTGTANGPAAIEGPHYPEPHRWYASVTLQDGVVVAVK